MSRPRYDWWPYVKGMIRRYPALAEQYEKNWMSELDIGEGDDDGA